MQNDDVGGWSTLVGRNALYRMPFYSSSPGFFINNILWYQSSVTLRRDRVLENSHRPR